MTTIEGGCQCGAVKYEVNGDIQDFVHCHCSICRKLHGAAFVTWAGVRRDDFRYTRGEEQVKVYDYSIRADTRFCEICGSRLLVDFQPEPDMLYITLGTVDGDVKVPRGYHQFVASKASWHDITDDLDQYDAWREDEYELIE